MQLAAYVSKGGTPRYIANYSSRNPWRLYTCGSLRVNRALSDGKLTAPKTKRSRRRIDLGCGSVAALKVYRKRQLKDRMQKAGLWRDHGLVFPTTVSRPLSNRNVVRSFKALLKRAGLPVGTRLYDLSADTKVEYLRRPGPSSKPPSMLTLGATADFPAAPLPLFALVEKMPAL